MKKNALALLLGAPAVALAAFGGVGMQKLFVSADSGQTPAEAETAGFTQATGISIQLPEQKLREIASTPWEALAARAGAPLADKDFTGEWVHTFESLTSNMGDGGGASTITTIAGTDSIEIKNLWISVARVRGKLDRNTGKLTIPVQTAFKDNTYGDIYIAPAKVQDGTPDRTKQIEGTVTAEGITISGLFGMYVASEGEYKDAFLGVCHKVSFERPNASMTATAGTTDYTYGVIVKQTSDNMLEVKNFGNFGRTINMTLNRNNTATIPQQVVREDAAGEWLTIGNPRVSGSQLLYVPTITTNAATDLRQITWGGWSMLAEKLYGTLYTGGKLTLPFDVKYPKLNVTHLTGHGTKESPYLITCLDELVLMADSVNNNNNFNIVVGKDLPTVSRTFENKYFRLENDIDMAGFNFDPIGHDYRHRFNGEFDGNGHTLKNLTVNTGINGYAGLFGYADTLSVVKNLRLTDANVQSNGFGCGVAAAYSLGRVADCESVNPKVTSRGQVVGGLLGSGYVVERCAVSGAKVSGSQGIVGALAGQVRHSISRSYAKDSEVVVSTPSDGAIAGGLVGSLFISTATDCWFAGEVDSYSSQSSMYLGGIAGVCFNSTMERCFSVARIMGYGQPSKNGGVAGYLMGTLRDCYSAGTVQCRSSYNTGGITGTVERYQLEDGTWKESELHNCYTSVVLDAEKSFYQPDKESRETLGRITGGSNPVIENVYGDRRMSDFKSLKYGSDTDELTSAQGPKGFDAKVWLLTKGQYPRLRGLENTPGSDLSASVMAFPQGTTIENINTDIKINPLGATQYRFITNGKFSDAGHFAQIKGDSLVINKEFKIGTDTLCVTNGGTNIIYFVQIAPSFLEGGGTEADPYLIKTKDDLIKLADASTNKNQLFAGTYFKLANDIDMEYDQSFVGIGCGPTTSSKFSGTIDGAGHTIHRMRNHFFEWSVKPEDSSNGLGSPKTSMSNGHTPNYAGLVGRLALDGVVKNITMAADCDLVAFASNGAIVGQNYGLVENCVNHAPVKTYSMTCGGIVSSNQAGGKIVRCLNTGTVQTGYNYAGGIAGQNQGLIEECVNVGRVEAVILSSFQTNNSNHKYAGGIAGNSTGGTCKNVANYGSVYTMAGVTGGITARLDGTNVVDGAINVGIITSADKVTLGAIGGSTGTKGKVAGYWDGSLQSLKAAANQDLKGLEGIPTSRLVAGKAIEGFDESVWDFTAGMYPTIKALKDNASVKAARQVVASFPDGCVAADVTADVPLAQVQGLSWKLAAGKNFSIASGNLKRGNVTKTETDTLIATYDGGRTKRIEIKANAALPLDGQGTEAAPYLVHNDTEWNTLAEWISATGIDLEGRFVRLEADIDFKGKRFVPVCTDGVTYFNGTFLGNGKTISNVALTTDGDYQGIFGTVGAKGTVRDLTISGKITSANLYTGGLAGRVFGTVENITAKADVTSTKNFVGGVIGMTGGGSTVRKVVFKGSVTGSMNNIGGIAAYADYGSLFEYCGNEGTVVNTAKGNYTAGIVANSLPSTFIHCYNAAKIEIEDLENAKNVAGIIAYANGTTTTPNPYTIRGCYNTAELYAFSKVAGIVAASGNVIGGSRLLLDSCYNTGYIHSVSIKSDANAPTAGIVGQYTPGSMITNCYNTGKIESEFNLSVAGIAGMPVTSPTVNYPAQINNCWNSGEIIAQYGQAGGIVGLLGPYMSLSNCHNEGAVSGNHSLGGIVGAWTGANTTISDCYNLGNVTSFANRVGGIVGNSTAGNASTMTQVVGCWNAGFISTTCETQGTSVTSASPSGFAIGGLAGVSRSKFIACYNVGVVKGASQVGGLVGQPMRAMTSFDRCYNIGDVVAPADTCGNIVGINTGNSRMWNESNTVNKTYYLEDNKLGANDVVGEGLSVAGLAKVDMGSGYIKTDDYTYPILAGHQNIPHALFYAAQPIFADGESESVITKPFHVGTPEGVSWTISAPGAVIDGNDVKFNQDFKGDAVLTLTVGNLKREYKLKLDVINGIDGIAADRGILRETYFSLSGVRVAKPDKGDGKVYIVVVEYEDGTSKTFKLINK